MPFPRKFKDRLELELQDLERPDYLWLTYAVCGVEMDSCGWEGWISEAVFRGTDMRHPTGTGDKLLPMREYSCADCGKPLFRTSASLRFEVSEDQTPVGGVPGEDYDVADMEYDDGEI
jgi:hypothetical protein